MEKEKKKREEYAARIRAQHDEARRVKEELEMTEKKRKEMKEKGIITVHTGNGRNMLHVAVRDTGLGIKAGNISKLFQPPLSDVLHPPTSQESPPE